MIKLIAVCDRCDMSKEINENEYSFDPMGELARAGFDNIGGHYLCEQCKLAYEELLKAQKESLEQFFSGEDS